MLDMWISGGRGKVFPCSRPGCKRVGEKPFTYSPRGLRVAKLPIFICTSVHKNFADLYNLRNSKTFLLYLQYLYR